MNAVIENNIKYKKFIVHYPLLYVYDINIINYVISWYSLLYCYQKDKMKLIDMSSYCYHYVLPKSVYDFTVFKSNDFEMWDSELCIKLIDISILSPIALLSYYRGVKKDIDRSDHDWEDIWFDDHICYIFVCYLLGVGS